MADENIQIQIEDKVAPSISTKLKNIATQARESYTAVEILQRNLNSLSVNKLNTVLQSTSKVSSELQKTTLASQRLATEQQRTAKTAAQVATAQAQAANAAQKLATEQARTAAASANAANAQDRAAIAALRLQQAQDKASQATNKLQQEGERLKRSLFPLYDAEQEFNQSVSRASVLYEQAAIDLNTYNAALARAKARMEAAQIGQNALNNGMVKGARSSELQRHHLVNLGYQIQDVGVSLASGLNPLTVFVQQGSQIAGIASAAGVSLGSMAKQIALLLLPFAPLVALLGAAYGAFKLFQAEVEKGANLEKYARDLGATSKEIKQLNLDTVTFGDTLKGLWATINDNTGVNSIFSDLWESSKKAFKNILGYAALSLQSLIALFQASFDTIKELWNYFPNFFKRIFVEIANTAIEHINFFVNAWIKGINLIIKGLNTISTIKIDPFEEFNLDKLSVEGSETAGKNLADVFAQSYVNNLEKNKQATSNFITDWVKNTEESAKKRVKKAIEGDTKTAEKRSTALEKVNAQLDNELERMFKLRPEREAQARLDQIEEGLISKKIKLTNEEKSSIEAKIKAIQNASEIQKQYDTIYEEATGHLREYNAVQEAAKRLLNDGAISQEQYSKSVLKASEAYKNAIDPLRQYNRDLDEQQKLLTLLPKQREIEQQIMQVQNDLLSQGIVLNESELKQLREKLVLIQQLNAVSQQQDSLLANSIGKREEFINQLTAINNLLKDSSSGFTKSDALTAIGGTEAGSFLTNSPEMLQAEVDTLNSMYQQIDSLRQADLISEQTAAAAKIEIWNKQQNAQLQTSKNFFGSLEVLQKSSNSRLSAIGKAAAIANALINTYQSATAAYAAMASIPYVGPVLGAAAAAAAIAAGLENVAQIRSQQTGFMAGGYTGNIAKDQVAGVVHGQEFVMDAATTNRIGVGNLESLKNGAASIQRNNEKPSTSADKGSYNSQPKSETVVNVPFTAVVVQSKEAALSSLKSSEGKAIVLEIIEENNTTVAKMIGAK